MSRAVLLHNAPVSRPELQHLRIFAAVAEARSYRRAAVALNLSPSAVSQALRRLEEHLGVPLLNRSTRSVGLTAAGERLLQQAMPALRSLEQALANVGELSEQIGGSLRLSVPRSAARLLLTTIVARFLTAHPQVQLELDTSGGLVDIVEQGFDAGVRFSERLPGDMVAVPIGGPQPFIVVASPALMQRHAPPAHPKDLLDRPCVRQRLGSGALFRWDFERHGQRFNLDVAGPLTVDDQSVVMAAALDGVGFAYVYECEARQHLSAGRLVQCLNEWMPVSTGFALYYPGRRQTSPALRAFIEMLDRPL
jgi:DNA-binding transcriptional LysR family regulator